MATRMEMELDRIRARRTNDQRLIAFGFVAFVLQVQAEDLHGRGRMLLCMLLLLCLLLPKLSATALSATALSAAALSAAALSAALAAAALSALTVRSQNPLNSLRTSSFTFKRGSVERLIRLGR